MSQYDLINFLARFWGSMALVFALIFLFKKNFMKSIIDEFDHLGALSASLGFLTVIVGLASVSLYSTWSFDWRVLITIFGWACLIKGVRILILPDALNNLIHSQWFIKYVNVWLVILGGIGLFMFIKSF